MSFDNNLGNSHGVWPGASFWNRVPHILGRVDMVIVALSLLTQTTLPLLGQGSMKLYFGLVLSALGSLLAYTRYPKSSLIFVCAGPIVAALVGAVPVGLWSVGCFIAFYLTINGTSSILVIATIGASNYVAEAIYVDKWTSEANPTPIIAALSAVALAAIGATLRAQRLYWLQLEQRTADALASRESALSRGIAEERLRIARDLHDSVGHNIAVANMRIGSAEVSIDLDRDKAQADLEAARKSLQSVLQELQQILRVLRVGDLPETLLPTPDHRQVPELIASFREAGLVVDADIEGLATELRPDVSAATYRITQEALTNAQKHGTGLVRLAITQNDMQGLVIEVSNRCRSRNTTGGGYGLPGLRERIASVGGQIEFSQIEFSQIEFSQIEFNSDDVTFRIKAVLPTEIRSY